MTLIPNTRNIAYTWINKQKMYRFTEINSMNTKLSFYQQSNDSKLSGQSLKKPDSDQSY